MPTCTYTDEPTLIGSSSAMGSIRSYVAKISQSDVNVLISGETGTGKEIVAAAIHHASPRHAQPFVAVNCAAIPDALLESELFGYERGAFTGADRAYPGKFRLADQGTIFLDEIGEMSLLGQTKILRVLETRELAPLGARHTSRINVRFLAATNQLIEPMLRDHSFRQDLYFRLNVGRISLPSLRERCEDIQDLFEHFVRGFNLGHGTAAEGPTPELLECLLAYSWPGNVRELRNCVEAVFIDPPRGRISLEHLPESFQQLFRCHRTNPVSEREAILLALSRTRWNKKLAAHELQWSRMTLYRKLAKYQISSSHPRHTV